MDREAWHAAVHGVAKVDKQKLLVKLKQIESDIIDIQEYFKNLQISYEVLTDQYMNGDILDPIGKEQDRIMRKIDKAQRRYWKLQQQANKIRQKLNMM